MNDELRPDCTNPWCIDGALPDGTPCTCGADTPTTPAPTADEVREAKEFLASCWRDRLIPSAIHDAFRTLLAALDRAQGEVEDLGYQLDAARNALNAKEAEK